MPLTIDLEDLARRGYKFGPKFLQLDSCTQFHILRPLLQDPTISLELFGTDDPWNLRESNQPNQTKGFPTSNSFHYEHVRQGDNNDTDTNYVDQLLNIDETKAIEDASDLKSEENSECQSGAFTLQESLNKSLNHVQEDTDIATAEGFIKNNDYEEAIINKIMNETLDPSLREEIGVNTVSTVFTSFRRNFQLIQEYISQKYSTMPEDDDIYNLNKLKVQKSRRRKLLSLSVMDSYNEN